MAIRNKYIICIPEILDEEDADTAIDSILEQNPKCEYLVFQIRFYGGEVAAFILANHMYDDVLDDILMDLFVQLDDAKVSWEFLENTIWEDRIIFLRDFNVVVPSLRSKEPIKLLERLCNNIYT